MGLMLTYLTTYVVAATTYRNRLGRHAFSVLIYRTAKLSNTISEFRYDMDVYGSGTGMSRLSAIDWTLMIGLNSGMV